MKKHCGSLVVGSVLNSNFPIFKGGKIGTSRFSYFQGFGSQHHLARMHLTSFWARTPSLNTYFSWRALYSDDTFDSSRHKRRTSTRPGEDNQDVTQ